MKFNSFLKPFLFAITVVFFISCDKDFNEIGADFVDSDHYNFTTQKYDVVAYNQNLGPVQTNNLPINALGYYNNPVFGRTKASFVTQLELATVNPTFVKASIIAVDSVYLHVPYFSKLTATDANGDSTYNLDSIYGSGKIQLEVFRNNYYLRNLDPNPISGLLEQQNYFSDQKSDFEANHVAARLNKVGAPSSQSNDFEFSPNQIKFLKTDPITNLPVVPNVVRERLAPGIYMDLQESTFLTDIIQAGTANLADNNAFKNYYRGLYFRVSGHPDFPGGAALSLLNFAQGKIVIVYRDAALATDTTPTVRKTMTLNMKGYTVNLLENIDNATNGSYNAAISNNVPDAPTGDSKLYLKGGQGAMAIIDLFRGLRNDDLVDPADPSYQNPLQKMRDENWLINEANLVFNIDDTPSGLGPNDISLEANRILLYDLNNKRPLIDYYTDSSTNPNVKFNKLVHSGIVQKVSVTDRGTKYKIRITNHIRNLIKYGGPNVTKDSTNVKLGLVITENINTTASAKLKNPFSYIDRNPNTGMFETKTSKYVPVSSVMSPLGTVLFGNNVPSTDIINYDKRLQLEIVYTKPD